jgi:hypothetical protein
MPVSLATPVSGVVYYGMLFFLAYGRSCYYKQLMSCCVLISFILIRKNQVNKYVLIFVFNNFK